MVLSKALSKGCAPDEHWMKQNKKKIQKQKYWMQNA